VSCLKSALSAEPGKKNLFIMIKLKRPLQNVQFCSSSRKAKILTTGIYWIFRGLKFESDAEIGQKGTLFKGLLKVCDLKGV